MFTGFLKSANSTLTALLPLGVMLLLFTVAYYLYKANESLKETISKQELIISDLRAVNVKIGGLYSSVYNRLNLEGLRSSESVLRLDRMAKDNDVLNIPLPKEVVDLLNKSKGSDR